jgi:hypothetical protein
MRRKLLENCDVHTILRLPTGIFYAQGVKANVLFFDEDAPLKLDDLQDFITCYNPENRHERKETERFKFFSYDDLMARDKASLDIFWLKDDSLDNLDDLPPPDVLQQEIIEHLEAALAAFRDVAARHLRRVPVADGPRVRPHRGAKPGHSTWATSASNTCRVVRARRCSWCMAVAAVSIRGR